MPFEGNVIVTPCAPDGKRWTLVESFRYHGKHESFDVPAGMTTDFASVPRVFVWLLPRYGRWTQAAILHDHLWAMSRRGEFNKADADGIFNRALRELEVPFLRRWIMWCAVRWAAGPKSWFAGGPVQFVKMVLIAIPTLALIALPALMILVALLLGAIAELICYLPLKLFRRDRTKQVNPVVAGDILVA